MQIAKKGNPKPVCLERKKYRTEKHSSSYGGVWTGMGGARQRSVSQQKNTGCLCVNRDEDKPAASLQDHYPTGEEPVGGSLYTYTSDAGNIPWESHQLLPKASVLSSLQLSFSPLSPPPPLSSVSLFLALNTSVRAIWFYSEQESWPGSFQWIIPLSTPIP